MIWPQKSYTSFLLCSSGQSFTVSSRFHVGEVDGMNIKEFAALCFFKHHTPLVGIYHRNKYKCWRSMRKEVYGNIVSNTKNWKQTK